MGGAGRGGLGRGVLGGEIRGGGREVYLVEGGVLYTDPGALRRGALKHSKFNSSLKFSLHGLNSNNEDNLKT